MTRKRWPVLFLLFSLPGLAEESWTFSGKTVVSRHDGSDVFHHLDSAGRKNIAVSGKAIAMAWEDNHSGSPQVYAALKTAEAADFGDERQISAGKAAYEPAVVPLGAERFLIGWEQDGAVWLRMLSPAGLGAAVRASRTEAGQAALAAADGRHVAAWSERAGRFRRIVSAQPKIDVKRGTVTVALPKPVDPAPPTEDQSYPTVAITKKGVTVAWEDRRPGHTVLLYSHAARGKPFGKPTLLNEVVRKSERYGRGSGATRVAFAVAGVDRVAAAWMDKRNFLTGYDIYAAFSEDGGARFGVNEIAQDAFAEHYAQWHPAIAADAAGRVVVAWDDDRDGSSDIWLAWKTRDRWSSNLSPGAASGDARRSNPVIALDAQGNLHMAWLEQEAENGPNRIVYAMGRFQRDPPPAFVTPTK